MRGEQRKWEKVEVEEGGEGMQRGRRREKEGRRGVGEGGMEKGR